MNWLDYSPIASMIAESRLTEWNKEAVMQSVVKAVETWLPGDADAYNVEGVEIGGEVPMRYKIDLLQSSRSGGPMMIVDWKTKLAGKLDDRWEMRETRSRQRKLYAAALAEIRSEDIFPVRYEVRGIVLDEDRPQRKTLVTMIELGEARRAVDELRDIAAMRDTLHGRGNEVWTRDESGCRLYGDLYKCEFEDVCWNGVRAPEGDPERTNKPMSHSKAKEFLRCPERYRLIQITDKETDDDEDSTTGPGTIFHRAAEMIYGQLRQFQLTRS